MTAGNVEWPAGTRDFVAGARLGRLATVDASGAPHVVPVCYALLEDRIYSAVDEKPKRTQRLQRLRNIAHDARVALVVDVYDEDWDRLAWVLVRGRAEVLTSGADYARALAAMRAKYDQYRTMALEGRPLIRLTPERVTAWGALAEEAEPDPDEFAGAP